MITMIRLAWRELVFSRHRLRLAVLVLSLGLMGPVFSSSLQSSVDEYLRLRSQEILAADLALTSTRPLRTEERASLFQDLAPERVAEETEFVTMGKGKDVSTLIEVKGVDANFPIFGEFRFQSEPVLVSARALTQERIAWVFPEVLAQLGLKVGESLEIGSTSFRISSVLDDAPGLSRVGGFAPRVYIGRNFIEETGLTQFGSQIFYRVYLQLPARWEAAKAVERAKEILPDPDIFLRTPDDSIQGMERFFQFFNLYLVSISMIVFALSWVSAFYILEVFIQECLKNAAILLTAGASRLRVSFLYALQIFLLQTFSLSIAVGVVGVVLRLAPLFLKDVLPRGFVLSLGLSDILTMIAVVLASAAAFSAPIFVNLYSVRLNTLLSESSMGAMPPSRRARVFSYGPMLVVFMGLSAWLMESWISMLQLTGGLAVLTIFGWFVGRLMFRVLFVLVRRRPGHLRLVATQLARARFGMTLCFFSLLLVAVVLNLVPHLFSSATQELRPLQVSGDAPSLFLFNIPESEVDSLQSFSREHQAELRYLSPMILARMVSVNGASPDDRFQRFPVRLSYRDRPIPSETLVEGREFQGRYDTSGGRPAEISMEQRFAERNKYHLGDVFEFDVQGVLIKGVVTSLRRVRWTDFNPNFFMMFQPGALDDAPKTYLANVNLRGPGSDLEARKVRFQYDLIKAFPNLSVIDIGRTISRVLEVVSAVMGPVQVSAALAGLMSFLIMVGVVVHNLRLRHAEVDIEKLMGAESHTIRRLIVSEYLILAGYAALFGASSALLVAFVATRQILDIALVIEWRALLGSIVLTVVTTGCIAFISCQRVLNLRGASRKL